MQLNFVECATSVRNDECAEQTKDWWLRGLHLGFQRKRRNRKLSEDEEKRNKNEK